MKSMIKASAATVLLCVAGWAAAGPVELTDNQMDVVAAGTYTYLHSGSRGSAFARDGLAGSSTTTSATVGWFGSRTSSSTVSLAVGEVARASSGGGSTIIR